MTSTQGHYPSISPGFPSKILGCFFCHVLFHPWVQSCPNYHFSIFSNGGDEMVWIPKSKLSFKETTVVIFHHESLHGFQLVVSASHRGSKPQAECVETKDSGSLLSTNTVPGTMQADLSSVVNLTFITLWGRWEFPISDVWGDEPRGDASWPKSHSQCISGPVSTLQLRSSHAILRFFFNSGIQWVQYSFYQYDLSYNNGRCPSF